MAPFPEYLSAVMSADASADAHPRINTGNQSFALIIKKRLTPNFLNLGQKKFGYQV